MNAITPNAGDHAGLGARDSRFVDVAGLPWEDTKFPSVKAKTLLVNTSSGLLTLYLTPAQFVEELVEAPVGAVTISALVSGPDDIAVLQLMHFDSPAEGYSIRVRWRPTDARVSSRLS